MREMTTENMIVFLGGADANGDMLQQVAARLKALEGMRRDLERYCTLAEKQIRAPLAEAKGFGSLPEVARKLRAILDAAREGS